MYCRTPLPPHVKKKVRWAMLYVAMILWSPFFSFGMSGSFTHVFWGWAALSTVLGVAGLVYLYLYYKTHVPLETRKEYTHGKLFPAQPEREGIPEKSPPNLYAPNGKRRLLLSREGVSFTSNARTIVYPRHKMDEKRVGADGVEMEFVPWRLIGEWEVHTDSDGPDYYTMKFHDKNQITVRRPNETALEPVALDYVRTVGGVPVRLFCDIEKPQ